MQNETHPLTVPELLLPIYLLQIPLLSWDGVMPANDPIVDLEVERLNGRAQGVIKVSIIQAKELKSYDTLTRKILQCSFLPSRFLAVTLIAPASMLDSSVAGRNQHFLCS